MEVEMSINRIFSLMLYTFNVAEGVHTVTIQAEGAGFATCTSIDYNENMSCNNDECTGAFSVQTDGTPRTSLDVTTYTSTGTNLSCDVGSSNEDAYYEFVAPLSGMVVIDVDDTNLSGTNSNIVEGALLGSCGGAEIDCFGWNNTNYLGSYNTASDRGRVVSGLTPGNTYYIEVEHYNNDWTGTYDVIIRDLAPAIQANSVTCLDLSDAFSISDIGSAGEEYNCAMFNAPEFTGSDEEEYLLYTPAANQTVNLIASSASYDDADGIYIGLFEWTPSVNANCLGATAGMVIDGGATSGQVNSISLNAGTTYVIVVGEDYNDAVSVCVEIQVECGSSSSNSVPTVDCSAGTYTGRVNFSSLGAGAVSYNIVDDLTNTFTSISTATDYDFNYTNVLPHTVTLKGYDGASNLVCQDEVVVFNSGCNGSESCAGAPDITNNCTIGDLSGAINEGTLSDNPLCGNGTYVRTCSGGFSPSSNYEDIWYSIDNSGGADDITINITDLTGSEEVIVFLYNGGCTDAELLDHNYQNPVTTSVTAPAGSPGGSCAVFNSANTSLNFYNLSAYSTIYVRVMPYVNASNCVGLVNANFTICAVVPEPNDVCSNAIDVTINNGGTSSDGNLSAASDEGIACLAAVSGKDLWYDVNNILSTAPNYTGPYKVQFKADGQTGEQMIVQLIDGCYTCPTITVLAMDTLTFASPDSTDFNAYQLSGGLSNYKIRVVEYGGTTTTFTASAKLIAMDDVCDYFNSPVTGFRLWDGTNPIVKNIDFDFATDDDLYFNFTSLAAVPVYSGSIEFNITGLGANESVTVEVYERDPLYSTNCASLTMVGSSLNITSDGTYQYDCLNEFESDYLVRVVNTGTDKAILTLSAEPSPPVPINDRCSNIWNGSSVTFNGTPFDITGTTLSADFTNARECDNLNSTCSGSDLTASKDLWFYFTIPADNCPDIAVSTKITDVTITYDASNAFKDGYGFVYSDCSDGAKLECSGSLDGAGDSFVASGLTTGQTYLVRIKPSSLNSGNDYSFDIRADLGPVRPCNDRSEDALALGNVIQSGLDRTSCLNGPYSALGATSSSNPASGRDVWLSFVAPSPANGQNYQTPKSYVTIYLQSLSGGGVPYTLNLRVYDEVGLNNAVGVPFGETSVGTGSSINTNTNGDGWLSLGHLTPGDTYYIRIAHFENETTQVLYDLCLYDTKTTDACNTTSIAVAEGVECANDCSRYFRVKLPDNAPSGYYRFEAIGDNGTNVNTRMFYQPNETLGTNEGDITDYDQPCGVQSLVAEEAEGALPDPGTCNGGAGFYGVYNLIGAVPPMANLYYLQVYDETNVLGCGGLDICQINIKGPYSSVALASAAGVPDAICDVTQPVELIAFEGVNSGNYNTLTWATASELNNDYFILERSEDGVIFEELTRVEGNGTINTTQYYEAIDNNPFATTYYRLVQVDFDGTTDYSSIIVVQTTITKQINLSPNPSSNLITITGINKLEAETAIIYDLMGKHVSTKITFENGNALLDIQHLPKGLYTINLNINGDLVSKTFIKR